MLPDFDRVDRIGEFGGHPETRTFGEPPIKSSSEGHTAPKRRRRADTPLTAGNGRATPLLGDR